MNYAYRGAAASGLRIPQQARAAHAPRTALIDRAAASTRQYTEQPSACSRHVNEQRIFTRVRDFWVAQDRGFC